MSPYDNEDLIAEDELRGLFARVRPEPEAFRSGIEQRIAEREAARPADSNEGEEDEPVRSSPWQRAAALLFADSASGGAAAPGLPGAAGGVPAEQQDAQGQRGGESAEASRSHHRFPVAGARVRSRHPSTGVRGRASCT